MLLSMADDEGTERFVIPKSRVKLISNNRIGILERHFLTRGGEDATDSGRR